MSPRKDAQKVAMESVIKAFDAAVDPSKLTPEQYVEFTGELIADLEIRLEAAVGEAKEAKARR